jgi:RNA polymerase sigma factor (sigma-70 family)
MDIVDLYPPTVSLPAGRPAAAPGRPSRARGLDHTVKAAAAGDGEAWSALVEQFGTRVHAVARKHRLGAHDVEDVAQTTWLRLLERIETVREPAALGAWLETTTRRESLRVIRNSGRNGVSSGDLGSEPADPTVAEDRLVAAERRAGLVAGVERLPADQKRLVSMLVCDPAPSYAEISRALDMPIGSIGPTRGRVLARLRQDRELVGAIGDDYGRPMRTPLVTELAPRRQAVTPDPFVWDLGERRPPGARPRRAVQQGPPGPFAPGAAVPGRPPHLAPPRSTLPRPAA